MRPDSSLECLLYDIAVIFLCAVKGSVKESAMSSCATLFLREKALGIKKM